jgi:divalent metal cation (Fe/Co/Zn/Cd) transporter
MPELPDLVHIESVLARRVSGATTRACARSASRNALFGWWWADPVAALAMTYFVASEGRGAWKGEACACGGAPAG